MGYFDSVLSARELLEDRIRLKIYWAEKHLGNLKNYSKLERFNETFETRLKWDYDAECLLFFLLGAKDALLVRICERLGLKNIEEDDRANIDKINPELEKLGKKAILDRLNKLRSAPNNWFWDLNQNRNRATHLSIVNILISRNIGADDKQPITLRVQSDRNVDAITYLETCVYEMKELIENTVSQEPLLG